METLKKVLARPNGLTVYQRRITSGAYTSPKSIPTPRQKSRLIEWAGFSPLRVLVKRSAK